MNNAKSNKFEFLKRRNRRNNLIKKLSNFTSVTYESLMEADINDLFCKKVFDLLSTLTNKVSIKEENYMDNIKTSIQLIEKTLKNSNLSNSSSRVLLFRDEEIEAVQININELYNHLNKILDITKFTIGYADFILVSDNLDFGICIERTEYQYEMYIWGVGELEN